MRYGNAFQMTIVINYVLVSMLHEFQVELSFIRRNQILRMVPRLRWFKQCAYNLFLRVALKLENKYF